MELMAIARRLNALAQSGMFYTKDPYDLERFEEVRELAAHLVAGPYSLAPLDVLAAFDRHVSPATPLVDVRAVIVRNDKILLVRDPQEQRWSLPGGWAEVGLTPEQSVEKEVVEETGLTVSNTSLLGVEDNLRDNQPNSIFHAYKLFFACAVDDGPLRTSIETDAVEYHPLRRLPELSVHRSSARQIAHYTGLAALLVSA